MANDGREARRSEAERRLRRERAVKSCPLSLVRSFAVASCGRTGCDGSASERATRLARAPSSRRGFLSCRGAAAALAASSLMRRGNAAALMAMGSVIIALGRWGGRAGGHHTAPSAENARGHLSCVRRVHASGACERRRAPPRNLSPEVEWRMELSGGACLSAVPVVQAGRAAGCAACVRDGVAACGVGLVIFPMAGRERVRKQRETGCSLCSPKLLWG